MPQRGSGAGERSIHWGTSTESSAGTYRPREVAEVTRVSPSCPRRPPLEKKPPPGKVRRSIPPAFLGALGPPKLHCFFRCPRLIGPPQRIPIGCGCWGHALIGPCLDAGSVFCPGPKPWSPLRLAQGPQSLSSLSLPSGLPVASCMSREWGRRVHRCPSLQG